MEELSVSVSTILVNIIFDSERHEQSRSQMETQQEAYLSFIPDAVGGVVKFCSYCLPECLVLDQLRIQFATGNKTIQCETHDGKKLDGDKFVFRIHAGNTGKKGN